MNQVGIITPVKNEKENAERIVDSVISQEYDDLTWVIVDDDSIDGSYNTFNTLCSNKDWIHVIKNEREGGYDISSVGKVLNIGYQYLQTIQNNYDFYMVLDGDMRLTPRYIYQLIQFLEENKNVVIASGEIFVKKDGEFYVEDRSSMHPAGGATLYSGEFFDEIDGPPQSPSWDSVAKAKARIRGYECRYVSGLSEKAIQARKTGDKGGEFGNSFTKGGNDYFLNMNPVVVVLKSAKMTMSYPFYRGALFLSGYINAFLKDSEQLQDEELRKYYYYERPKEIVRRIITRR